MSQIIENRSDIDGVVENVTGSGNDMTVHVRVDAARPVGSVANLVSEDVGEVIAIRVRDAAAVPATGSVISCRVRKVAVDRFFADEGSLQIRRRER
jgi:hypothetical protein